MLAEPGWYADPSGAEGQRYFDGADWTEYRAVAPVAKRRAWPWMVAGVLVLCFALSGTALVVGHYVGTWTRVTASDGRLQFAPTDFSKAKVQDDPLPTGEYFLVGVTVTNSGSEAQSLNARNQKLIDAAGREYPALAMVAEPSWKQERTAVDIDPGTTLRVVMRFDGPRATKVEAVEFHDSESSAGARFNL